MKLVELNKIFDIQYGNQFDLYKLETDELSDINFVSRSSQNLGVVAKVSRYNDVEPFPAGLITVTLGGTYLLSSFIQQDVFYTAQNIKVLKPKKEMSFEEKIFYCKAIEANRFRYTSHGREANTTLNTLLVPENVPQKILKINSKGINFIEPKSLVNKKIDIKTKEWKYFNITDIFTLEKCNCYSATELLESGNDIYYIGAKKNDNGIMDKVIYREDLVSKGNCIVFIGDGQGSVGYVTYQPVDFIGSTTLTCGYNDYLNEYNALFLVTILDLERFKYSFGRKYGKSQLQKTKIKLPSKNNLPDFEFMENYIKSLPYSASIRQT